MAGSTAGRIDFGHVMKEYRKKAGKVPLAAAVHLDKSRTVIMRLEEGKPTSLARPQIESLLAYYGVDAEARVTALGLWDNIRKEDREAKARGNSRGFWEGYTDQVAPNFSRFLRLEEVAEAIITHQLVLVPGLLQTADYRRDMTRINNPDLSAVDIERRIELTERRQARLAETGFRYEALLSEAVLRHQPARRSVMAEQLLYLAEVGERDDVSIRVIPFAVGPHWGLTIQSFTMLNFPVGASGLAVPPVAFIEGAFGSLSHDQPAEIAQYGQAISAIREVALSEESTRDLVFEVAKEHAA